MGIVGDLRCDQNDSLLVTDQVVDANGLPVDITDWSIRMTFHRNAGDTTAIISYTTGGGGIVIPVGTDGVLQVTIPNADVRKLPTSYSHWSIARTDAGQEAGLSRGLIWVEPV